MLLLVSGAQGVCSIQEHNDLVNSISRVLNKLVIHSASHEPLENEVDPFLLTISKNI